MQCGMLDQFLEQKNSIIGRIGEIQTKSGV